MKVALLGDATCVQVTPGNQDDSDRLRRFRRAGHTGNRKETLGFENAFDATEQIVGRERRERVL